ncbi:MAG: hypothetical protein JETCAE03_33940 [Ignavibacteriaceae bacterium]|jgi:hypothetical protein|nr:MAG: hypothetical protein JETCAE03_33940 [Ignavibacteriaceae bacterium]
MSYLNNDTVTVDAILTKRGRELFSQGNFSISKFALADDEVDYNLYDSSHPSGSDYYDVAIRNLPMLEAIPDGSKMMRFKLITLPKGSSQIPIISVGLTQISLRAPYLNYPGQSQIVTPSTVNGLNSTLGYTATIGSSQYVTLAVAQGSGGGGGGIPVGETQTDLPVSAPLVNTTGLGGAISGNGGVILDSGTPVPGFSVVGQSFILTAKAVPDNSTYSTTLRITGNETGGEVVLNVFISRQTIGEVTASWAD